MKKQLILTLIVIYSLFFVTACPPLSRITIEKAKNASHTLAAYANESVNVTRDLLRAKILTAAQTSVIADKFIALSKGGQTFDAFLLVLEQNYGKEGKVRSGELTALLKLFNSNVVNLFLDCLTELKILQVSERLRQMMDLLKTSILIVARALQIEKTTKARIEAVS